MKSYITILLLVSAFAYPMDSQSQITKQNKTEAVLTAQSWNIYKVKSRRPYGEIGETFNFRIDKSFYYDQNNYAKRGGKWMLTDKNLVLIYDSFTEERKRIPIEHKVKKLKSGDLVLKYRNRNSKKEKIYLN